MKKILKKKKLPSIPKINRKLFKLWSEAVRDKAGNQCEFCGKKAGEDNGHGIINKLDSHHILSRKISNCPLKFDIRNGVLVDPFHHKWGIPSFHRDPVTTITWLIKNRPKDYEFVLNNSLTNVDLANRFVLAEIEEKLKSKEPLDLDKLKDIEAKNPRPKKEEKPSGTLFDKDEVETEIEENEDDDDDDDEGEDEEDKTK
jgi:hypothetical protein